MKNRRTFLKASGLALAAAATPVYAAASKSRSEDKSTNKDMKLGIASYSLRKFSQEQALDMALRCGIDRICFKSMHLPLDSDEDTIQRAVALCKEKGITLYGAGVVYMKSKEEADQAFRYAHLAGMEMIVGVPNHELLEYVEEKVKEYNIKLAIHNHGPGDKLYPSAESAYVLIKDMDERMGLCIDIGHTKRINRDPEKDLKDYFDRVFDIHIKDVTEASKEGKTCIIGRGVIDIVSFLGTILDLNYSGTLALEFEADSNDPLPGMMESLGYVRGVLDAI